MRTCDTCDTCDARDTRNTCDTCDTCDTRDTCDLAWHAQVLESMLWNLLESVGLESMERVECDLWRGLNAMPCLSHACHMPVTCLSLRARSPPVCNTVPNPAVSLSLPPYLLPSLPPSLPPSLCSVQRLPEVCASVKRDLSLSQKRTISKRCIPELRASHRTPCD